MPVGDRVGPPARLGDGHGQQFGECGFVVDDQHADTVPTGPLAAGPLATEAVPAEVLATVPSDTGAVAAVTLAAHAGPVAVAEDTLTGDSVATGTFATDGVAGGVCGAEAVAALTSAAHAGPSPVDVLATVTSDTGPLTAVTSVAEALAPVMPAAHAGPVAVVEDTLTGDTVAAGAFATGGVAGGACGVETFASGARHMTILSRFAGRTLCSDFAAAVRRASREEPAVLNPLGRRGHWHGPATGIP
ncbi:hypothetical protein ACFWBS_16545 [Streptomyces mirabilis]|uniref:hypothetical protein n=1 Tax=Streptomyces TaxID=1883 RepID=UPI0015CF7BB6|nr:hypothetical protein [Streptomyces sp. OK228]